ncbi:hypothetical protein ACOMHN_006712 [Nucella lapillus]
MGRSPVWVGTDEDYSHCWCPYCTGSHGALPAPLSACCPVRVRQTRTTVTVGAHTVRGHTGQSPVPSVCLLSSEGWKRDIGQKGIRRT